MAPKTAAINTYLAKMEDQDMDFRYMALNDLTNTILEDPALFGPDDTLEAKTVNKVIALVQDKNSEVKNQAVKCLGQLVKVIKETQMNLVVDSLVVFIGGKDDELRDIAGLALKTVTAELPNEGRLAERACSTLAPKLLAAVQVSSTPPETVIEMLSILSILLSRFPVYLADVSPSPVTTITPLLSHARIAVRKRAAVVLAQSLPSASQASLDNLIASTVTPGFDPKAPIEQKRTVVLLLGAMGRYAPNQVAPVLPTIVPAILNLSAFDDEELRESSLQTLEALVLKCPSEMAQFISGTVSVGTTLIKYDPNYTEDEEDEEMADADDAEDDEDEDLGEDYSDDEDTSYKIRRSATKLLAAIIATRPDYLVTIYRSVAPVLIMRFGEREESVRLDVWAAYTLLLQQTNLYGSAQSKDVEGTAGTKRKREDEGMDLEETPLTLLKSQIPGMTKSLLRHLQPKSSDASLQAGFGVLRSLLVVAPGSLTNQMPSLASVTANVLNKGSSSTSSLLHTTIISFLDLVFSTHSPPSFSSILPQLTPALLRSLSEKDPRVAASGFRAFATLLNSLKPVRASEWVDPLYAQAISRLERNDTDAAVRDAVELCIAELWLSATDLVRPKGGAEWTALRKSGRTEGAVGVVSRVAKDVDFPADWVDEFVTWTLGVVRKSVRNQKDEALICLAILLRKYQAGLPSELIGIVIPQLLPYLAVDELSHFTNSLAVITLLLQMAPRAAYPVAEADILPIIYKYSVSQLPAGLLDSIVDFLKALVAADSPIANRLIPGLTISLEKAPAGSASPLNASRCIGAVVRCEMGLAAATVAEFAKSIKPGTKASDSRVILSLHVVGEIGRFIDMTLQSDVFKNSLALFAAESQDVRAAAAFAVGNIAIGNLHAFLPVIVKQISSSDEHRLLSLHALKEVVTHCTSSELEGVADTLWGPLFENHENSEESTRNVAAACLGRLTTTNPARYLPLLQTKLRDDSPAVRATVIASVRYTFADNTQSYDELLSPLILDFLSLVQDSDLTVRRLSLTALNAAARNKPALIRDQLTVLLPLLYGETVQKPDLIRVVDMGPWKHRVDDGLDTRKTAFETMYTILDTCLSNIDLHVFFTHVLRGLADESDEIKVLCHMMLFRLSQVAPTTVSQRLDEVSPELEEAIKGAQVTKDTVKQDLERAGELQRSALRAVAALSKISSPTVSPRMERLVESIEKGPLAREFREL